MAKHFVVLITLLTVLMLFVGCKPESIEAPQVQPQKTEILKTEPPKVEPPKTTLPGPEPNQAEPTKIEPNEPEFRKGEPNDVEPAKTELLKAKLQKDKPPKVEPNEVRPLGKVSPSTVSSGLSNRFHDKCASILNNFVDGDGMVNYDMLRRKRPELNKLLDEFAELDPKEYKSWPKEDKVAFWLNAYNIKMLKVIVDNYPVESTRLLRILWGPYSIRHIGKKIGGIWKSKFIVMDEEFTLLEIDQRFFRKEFDEPRVFLAINHASISSPPLRNRPYYGHKLNKQLDKQSKKFLSSSRAFRIDRGKAVVYLSAILKPSWYGQFFLKKYGTDKKFKDQEPSVRAVLNFIINYIPKSDVSFLELKSYTVKYLNYDWTINDGS